MTYWAALEPAPFTDASGHWPKAAIVHEFSTEAEAVAFVAGRGWEVRENFWSTVPVVVETPKEAAS